MSKSYFGLLDSRNAKYQGLIEDDHFAGIGMLIDRTNTFAITTWNASTMNGPSLIIYPTTEVFFGSLQANRPTGIVCFQFSRNEKCIINFVNNNQRNNSQEITIAYIISGQSIVQVLANQQKNEFKVVQVYDTNNNQDELKLLSKIFNSQISKNQVELTSFITKQYIQYQNLFQLSGKNQLFFGFKDTISIGFKMENNAPTSVGFFKPFPRNLIFGRKIHYNFAIPGNTSVEEGYFEPYAKTLTCLKQKASSLEFQKLCEQYFKKSTTFRNQFLALDQLSIIEKELKHFGNKVKIGCAKKFGQSLLENDYGSSHQNDIVVKEYTLEEMKQQIYRAAAKKNKVHDNISKSPIRQRTKNPLEDLYANRIDSPNKEILTVRKAKQPSLTRNQSILMSEPKQNHICLEERRKRGFTHQHSTKQDIIKEVDLIVKNTKMEEKALLEYLVDDFKSDIKKSTKKKQYNYSENVEEPVEKGKKYQRYEPKITPFSEVSDRYSRSALKSSVGRQVRYLHLQKAKEDPFSIHKSGIHEIIHRDKSVDRITPFDTNRELANTKSHANLSKYKDRHKQAKDDNVMKKDQTHQYSYFDDNQNHKPSYGEHKIGSNLMPELKLFEQRTRRNKQNQPLVEDRSHERSGQYLNQNLTKPTYLGCESSSSQKYGISDKSSALHNPQPDQRYKGLAERNNQVRKNYSKPSFHEDKNGCQLMRNEERKKIKRTFHYVD